MRLESMHYICRAVNLLEKFPIRLYQGRKLLHTFERETPSEDVILPVQERLFQTDRNFHFLTVSNLLMYCIIKEKNSEYSIVIGPASSVKMEDNDIREMILKNNFKLSSFQSLKKYFNSFPIVQVDRMFLLGMSLHVMLNDEEESDPRFDATRDSEIVQGDIFQRVANFQDSQDETEIYDSAPYKNFERQIMFIVKNGMEEDIVPRLTYDGWHGRPGQLATDSIRLYKNRCISMTTLVSRTAMDGGLDSDTAYRLFDLYCLEIEQTNDIDKMNTIQRSMLFDFTRRVRALHNEQINNPTISSALTFINKHLHEKLTASMIADHLKISPGYFSVLFKKVSGVSLPTYINNQKINEARNLLKFTNRSLIDISDFLAFSSQCYFQNIFKKVTGVTPMEYRDQEKGGRS